MKYIITFLFFFLSLGASSQLTMTVEWFPLESAPAGDTIYYHQGQPLQWKDFQGQPDPKNIAAAITASGFGYSLAMQQTGKHTNISITVYCFFSKSASWVKKGMKNDYALLHEQHHFDITYYNTCLFIQKLKQAGLTKDNCDKLAEQLNNECYAEMEKMQNAYDGQTRNGQLKEVQAQWNKKIDDMLASLVKAEQ
jgi:hypothetical protein